jgi:hypothetical protein
MGGVEEKTNDITNYVSRVEISGGGGNTRYGHCVGRFFFLFLTSA